MGEEAVLNLLSDTKSPWGFVLSLLIILPWSPAYSPKRQQNTAV